MEPICAQVFPGNYVDSRAYKSFVEKIILKMEYL